MDILTRLSAEHDDLRALLIPIESAAEARDDATLTTRLTAARAALTEDLDAHIATEEADVFSTIPALLGADLVAPFYEEHAEIRAVRDQVYAQLARGESPHEPALQLCALILEHQQREDLMLFPSARDAVSG